MAAESDVGETVTWCDSCEEERRFTRQQVDVSAREEASASPSPGAAISGETAWVCEVCGTPRRDPIDEGAYSYEQSNVGYRVEQLPDSAETVREASADGVEPAPLPQRRAEAPRDDREKG